MKKETISKIKNKLSTKYKLFRQWLSAKIINLKWEYHNTIKPKAKQLKRNLTKKLYIMQEHWNMVIKPKLILALRKAKAKYYITLHKMYVGICKLAEKTIDKCEIKATQCLKNYEENIPQIETEENL